MAPTIASQSDMAATRNYRRLVESARDLMCVIQDGLFLQVNLAFERVLGYPPSEVIGRPFVDFIHPEDRAESAAEAMRLTQGATTEDFENRYLRKDGQEVEVLWLTVRASSTCCTLHSVAPNSHPPTFCDNSGEAPRSS
ncbi:MAG: PAS domain S-box protein [Actinobacteria bacterium]|nr:PAS domain S-box protein [Actinomycetota bacterium]